MRRYKLRKRTYFILLGLTTMSSMVLIAALASEPPTDENFVLTGDDSGQLLPGPPGDFLVDYRTPVITVSVISIVGLVGAMAFSGGVKYIDRNNVLESPIRKEMFEYVKSNPGVYLREISRTLDINPTNTTWHLRKLTEAELVRCQMANGLKLYYPVEGGVKTKQTALANSILRNDNAKTIVAYLLAHPGTHQREIARALGVNHGTVRWHLKKLVLSDLVNEHREGSAYKYYISTAGMDFLSKSGEMDEVLAEGPGPAEAEVPLAFEPEPGLPPSEPPGH